MLKRSDVRVTGPAAHVREHVYRSLLADAVEITAVNAWDTTAALAWAAELPAGPQVEVLFTGDPPGGLTGRIEGEEAVWVLLALPRDGSPDPSGEEGRTRLVRAARDGDVRLFICPTHDRALPPTELVDVSTPDADVVVVRQRARGTGTLYERTHAFSGKSDPEHVDSLRREIDELRAAAAPLQPSPEDVRAELRGYQRTAIDQWVASGRRGILAMATGTGKTLTAIVAAGELAGQVDGLVTVVMAPLTHLVDQWTDWFRDRGVRAIACHTATSQWSPDASREVDLVQSGVRNRATLVTTYATYELDPFQRLVDELSPEAFLLVADEVHHLGSERMHANLPPNAGYRLGLSATPERWGDPGGNRRLEDYFGGPVYEYPLAQAIDDGMLAPYRYELHGFELGADELTAFRQASERYRRLLELDPLQRDPQEVERARTRRSDVLDEAPGKLEVLRRLLRTNRPDRTVIYCSGREQLDAVLNVSWNVGYRAQAFTGEEAAGKRQDILASFSTGDLPVLGAIRCLDEGVDIPSAREAYLLKSSGNPAQYVQRRGRLLRPSPEKPHAVIHDVIPTNGTPDVIDVELQRVQEFAGDALNGDQALDRFGELTGERAA